MQLLPLAPQPFVTPTDRDMLPSERREFVRTHRTCVFGYARRADGPSMSIVYYIPTDDDELLISTMGARAKTKAVARAGKVSLCILDERWPFAYLQVYCDARVDADPDLVVDVMMAVARPDVGPAASRRRAAGRAGDGAGGGAGRASLPSVRDVRAAAAAPAPERPGRRRSPTGSRRRCPGTRATTAARAP